MSKKIKITSISITSGDEWARFTIEETDLLTIISVKDKMQKDKFLEWLKQRAKAGDIIFGDQLEDHWYSIFDYVPVEKEITE